MKSSRFAAAIVTSALLSAATMAAPQGFASADGGDQGQAAAVDQAVTQVDDAAVATDTSTAPGLAVVVTDQTGTVEIPTDPTDGISFTAASGVEVGIGLPVAATAEDARVTSEGTAVYTDAAPSASVAAQALSDGSVRALVTIEGSDAPTQYRFPIDVPAGGRLEAQGDGTINVIDGNGMPAGHFDNPWATDATGNAVPTSLTIDGNTIVQTVSHTGNYPVVADPHYTWGWVTGTVYYTRAETRSMKTLSYGAVVAAGICAYFGAVTLGAACVAAGAFYAQWAYVSNNAYADGKCIKIKIPTFWASAYSGSDCH